MNTLRGNDFPVRRRLRLAALVLGGAVLLPAGWAQAADDSAPFQCDLTASNFIPAYTQMPASDQRASATVGLVLNTSTFCTGTLLASTAGPSDQHIRIATAAHCIADAIASPAVGTQVQAIVYWDAVGDSSTPSIRGAANPEQSMTLTVAAIGATDLSLNANDYALLVAAPSQPPPASAFFSGWDGSSGAIVQGATLTTLGFPDTNPSGNPFIPQMQYANVSWDGNLDLTPPVFEMIVGQGCTAPGTSGSGYFRDADLLDVGILVGSLSSSNFASAPTFNAGIALSNLVAAGRAELDPGNTGATSTSGYASATSGSLPVVNFSVSPTSITAGQSSTLNWSTSSADSCTASGAWSGPEPLNGRQSVTPSGTSTYTLTCSNIAGSATQSVTVTVTAASSGTGGSVKNSGGGGALDPASLAVLAVLTLLSGALRRTFDERRARERLNAGRPRRAAIRLGWMLVLAALPLAAAQAAGSGAAAAKAAYARGDYAAAVAGLRTAAAQGDSQARFQLGSMYHYGLGVARDDGRSVRLLSEAAGQGDPHAQFLLGTMLFYGDGAARDRARGEALLRAAAAQGVPKPE